MGNLTPKIKIPSVLSSTLSRMNLPPVAEFLSDDLKIVRDKTSNIHIFGRCFNDCVFGQGFVQAQERLFSLYIMRRVSEGTLSEIKPEPLVLTIDKMSRTFGFSRLGKEDAEKLSTEQYKRVECFAEGINFFLQSEKYFRMPLEIKLGRMPKPEKFTVANICSMLRLQSFQLARGLMSKVLYLSILQFLNQDDIFATQEFSIGEIVGKYDWDKFYEEMGEFKTEEVGGSNSFAISGKFTESGFPILESDPHLPVKSPSVLIKNHIVCPETDATGFTMVGAYGISIGFTKFISYGVTISYLDSFDVYVEEMNPLKQDECKWKGKWEKCQVVKENIRIKKKKKKTTEESEKQVKYEIKSEGDEKYENYTLLIRKTRHGPLLSGILDFQDDNKPKIFDFSVKGSAIENFNNVGYVEFMNLCLCKNWKEYSETLGKVKESSLTLTYADVEGNIGYFLMGGIPIRTKLAEQYCFGPLPGNGEKGDFEWKGIRDKNPCGFNPERGWVVCCNHNLYKDYPHFISNFFRNPCRAKRIDYLLENLVKKKKLTLKDVSDIRLDIKQPVDNIKMLMKKYILSKKVKPQKEEKEVDRFKEKVFLRAAEILSKFNGVFDVDSVGACLYTIFKWIMMNAMLEKRGIKDEMTKQRIIGFGFHEKFMPINEYFSIYDLNFQTLLSKFKEEDKIFLVNKSMKSALKYLEKKIPEKLSYSKSLSRSFKRTFKLKEYEEKAINEKLEGYKYSEIHQLKVDHVLGTKMHGFSLGPFPVPGTMNTLFQTAYNFNNDFNVLVIPTATMIVDMGDITKAKGIIVPGNSCHYSSPFFEDEMKNFLDGTLRNFYVNEEEIEKNKFSEMNVVYKEKKEMNFKNKEILNNLVIQNKEMKKEIEELSKWKAESIKQFKEINDKLDKLSKERDVY